MSVYTEKTIEETFPMLVLTDIVSFPSIPLSISVREDMQVKCCNHALSHEGYIFITNRNPSDNPEEELKSEKQLCRVGTVCKITSLKKLDSGIRIDAECYCRAQLVEPGFTKSLYTARVICKSVKYTESSPVIDALRQNLLKQFDRMLEKLPSFPKEAEKMIRQTKDSGQLADVIASAVLLRTENKLAVLAEFNPEKRIALLIRIFDEELSIIDTEIDIQKKTRGRVEENQRDYYLREQLKVIKNELGDEEEIDDEIYEYAAEIMSSKLPEDITKKLMKEANKLSKLAYASPESNVIRSYLDTVLELPWNKYSREKLNLDNVKKVLDRDHDGMDDVKNRILEYIAVKNLTSGIKNQIICLVGAPGVGKTSVASSIAKALGRKFARVSLGGIHDESDIRGHRKTYVAAMPGRIINALIEAGTNNPLILLDEIDKLTQDAHGDPASALLEVLDPDQNKSFRDHFIEIPYDLSDCIFIATANTLETISRPLIDRMEVIEMKSYNRMEKLAIAKHHLIPKQLIKHGLSKKNISIKDAVIFDIIDHYTVEAGVRGLEKRIAKICRKVARSVIEDNNREGVYKITSENLHDYLGPIEIIDEKISPVDEIGVVNGLAYTDAGGDMLKVEALSMQGSGKLELTGSLGDVMIESAKIALSLIRKNAGKLGIDPEFYKNRDIHIHFPEGAVPKDGPSAGVTLVTALASELGGHPVHRDVAMTGEVTLRGKVLAIGGLREKTMAAYKSGVRTVLVPADNKQDVAKLDDYIKQSMEFVYCSSVDQVLERALGPACGTNVQP